MKIITGVHKPDSGKIIYKGEEVNLTHPKQALELGIGIVYQEFNLFPDLTVAQNISISREPPSLIKGFINEEKLIENAKKALKQLNVNINPKVKVSELTVAEQQMVEIAKTISSNCNVLIMDEPTAALTESEIDALFNVILDLKKQGVSIIYISHRLEELVRIVDRVTVLRDGETISTYNYSDVTLEQLIKDMVGRSLEEKFPPKPNYLRGEKRLEVRNLTRSGVLNNINLSAYEGEVLGIAGLMGSGRTELARAIFGADPIDKGEILIDDKVTKIKSPLDAIKHGIGYITEDRKKDGLALSLSVKENIILASYPQFSNKMGMLRKEKAEETSENFVSRLKIKTPSIEQTVKNLSGGNQQKVVLAKWLCQNIKIVIFDEPTRGIDIGAKYEIYELIYELIENGVVVLVISSELPEILGICDRIVVLADGEMKANLSIEESTQEKILSYATTKERRQEVGSAN